MIDLKNKFQQYTIMVDDAEWASISKDRRLIRHNRKLQATRAAGYGLISTAIVSFIAIGCFILLDKGMQDNQTRLVKRTNNEHIVKPTTITLESNLSKTENQQTNIPQEVKTEICDPSLSTASPKEPAEKTAIAANTSKQPKSGSTSFPVLRPIATSKKLNRPTLSENVIPINPIEVPANIATTNDEVIKIEPFDIPNEESPLFIPNAFTPNNDNINDVFKVSTTADVINFEMYIYNRAGDCVFNSKNIDNGWDGKRFGHGNTLPQDVYVYTIRYTVDGTTKTEKGQVVLIK